MGGSSTLPFVAGENKVYLWRGMGKGMDLLPLERAVGHQWPSAKHLCCNQAWSYVPHTATSYLQFLIV